jgi:hypothetical protein
LSSPRAGTCRLRSVVHYVHPERISGAWQGLRESSNPALCIFIAGLSDGNYLTSGLIATLFGATALEKQKMIFKIKIGGIIHT